MLYKGILTCKTRLLSHPYIPHVILSSKVDYLSKGHSALKARVMGSN